MPGDKRWIALDEIQVPADFQSAIGGHPLVAQTLFRIGYQTIEGARTFLDPEAYTPTPANELPDIVVAYEFLADAIQNNKHILIWGDFDVDGQTATTTLVEGLRELGGNITYHIPVRGKESHGITREVLNTYLDQGFDLLLTCDTGISEHENIQHVRDAGIPVIVTDHHTLGETLPPANAIINPQRLPADHPLRTLPGVAVAYKLIEGLFAHLGHSFEPGRFLELSALGIVADVAELKGDTRNLLQRGLVSLRHTHRIGLQTLYENAELNPLHLNEDHIGFQIAPRLNAVGRLGDANLMVEFLTTQDPGRARVLATQIEAMNAKRRFATRQVEKAAESQLQVSTEDRHAPAIVLHHPDWPGGVVGIVASRLVDRYQKPAILLTGDDPIHGSARSVEGINIIEAIATQADRLIAFGGHPMAAGLSFSSTEFASVKRGFLSAVEERARHIDITPVLQIHHTLTLDEIKLELIEQIERLAPFGPGNPPLHFLLRDLTLISATGVGQHGEHRQVIAADKNENQQRFIWWNGGDEALPEAQFDLVCKLSQSNYKGSLQVSAEWIDFRLSERGRQEIARHHFDIIEHRASFTPMPLLQKVLNEFPNASVWGEGDLPDGIPGLGRQELEEAETLIIWTAPPSQSVLREVIRVTHPEHVVVFGLDPNLDNFKGIMERLAGLAKYAVQNKNGQISLKLLAAACAADIETIKIGLQLWEAMGKLGLDFSAEWVSIRLENAQPNQSIIDILQSIMKELLEESRAYRRYFKIGEINSLLTNDLSG